ncbi:hypothetical protein FRC10_002401 [Ceratobasidium sp. 414]|nr:hypothetical protein FRC10_002401 [Ceratobasidium sp. 414]
MARTGIIPYVYQVRCAEALYYKRDVFCIAGTGCGKTLIFAMLCFVCPKALIWIVSPLNFIENQQSEQFRTWGLHAIGVNASTITPKLIEDIKAGHYQVIISSPESYHESNKLRPALLSSALEDRLHVTVIDEAHCVKTWGDSFRKAYARCGDLRPRMLNPENCPLIAATATATPAVKSMVKTALQIRKNYHSENLGNFRDNMTHEVFRMTGGQRSYNEVTRLLPLKLADVTQTIVFVNDYKTAHAVAAVTRKHYGLNGKVARDLFPVYHALKGEQSKRHIERCFQAGKALILFSTEALTLGANFPNVKMVINYLVPHTAEIWLQRGGRAGRKKGTWCRIIIMATLKMLKDAATMCREAGIVVSEQLLNIKVEDNDSDNEDTPVMVTKASKESATKANGLYQMTIGIAEYIATEGCLVEVMDREFDNPPHIPCYDIGGCYNCKRQRQHNEQARLAMNGAPNQEDLQQYNPVEAVKHTAKELAIEETKRLPKDLKIFKKAIEVWREDKYMRLVDILNICEDAFMTDKELKRIAQFRITSVNSFDDPDVRWPGALEWRQELLLVIQDLELSEARKREEDQQVVEAERLEKQRLAQEHQKEKEQARQSKAQERRAKTKPTKQESTPRIQSHSDAHLVHPAASTFYPTPSTRAWPMTSAASSIALFTPNMPTRSVHPFHTPGILQGRALGTIRLNAGGRPLVTHPGPANPHRPYPFPIAPNTSVPSNNVLLHNQTHFGTAHYGAPQAAIVHSSLPGRSAFAGFSVHSGVAALAGPSTPINTTRLVPPVSQQPSIQFVDNILHNPNGPMPNFNQATPSQRRGRPRKVQPGQPGQPGL